MHCALIAPKIVVVMVRVLGTAARLPLVDHAMEHLMLKRRMLSSLAYHQLTPSPNFN